MLSSFKAGVASVCITPPIGIDLTGFGGRPSGAIGIHDDLYAKALVLSDGSKRVAIITADLLSLDFDVVAEIRERLGKQLGISSDEVMLISSHTHSGPATITLRGVGECDPAYIEVLIKKIVGAVVMADSNLRPAALGYRRGNVQIGINRREKREDGEMVLGKDPEGPVTPYVHLLRVDDSQGRPFAVLFSHAAHPVVLGGSNLLVSADYPGYAMRFVERVEGVRAMFANGCCGNINSNPAGGTFEDARRLGVILGAEVVKTLEQTETESDLVINSISETINLPLIDPPPADEARRTLEEYQRALDEELRRGTSERGMRMPRAMVEWAKDILSLAERGITGTTQEFEIQVISIGGDIAIVGLSGEVFVQYALNIERDSLLHHTFVVGYTNGCIGYIPTKADYSDGGYEVDMAYKLYGTQMIAPESEEIISDAALRLLRICRPQL